MNPSLMVWLQVQNVPVQSCFLLVVSVRPFRIAAKGGQEARHSVLLKWK